MTQMLPAPRLPADGFVMIESGRRRDGRLWFAHWGAGEVLAVDLLGQFDKYCGRLADPSQHRCSAPYPPSRAGDQLAIPFLAYTGVR